MAIAWLFLDLNSFFASCEQQENPHYRGRPLAVLPMLTEGTSVIAASYEAKAYGIKTGTKVYEARRLCPDLICVLARHDLYVRYHHLILEEVIKHTPIHTVASIDELSSRLPPNKQSIDAACTLANRIKAGLRNEIGTSITCSIGLAPNAFLAKVASDMQKPDGLVILTAQDIPHKLYTLKLTDLPGISTGISQRLYRAGIYTISHFCALSPKQARAVWGSVEGERFWYHLHGHVLPTQPTKRRMIGHSRMLDPEHRTQDVARLVGRRLTLKAASRLRREKFYASELSLAVRTVPFQYTGQSVSWFQSVRLPAVQDNHTILEAYETLWRLMLTQLAPPLLKKITVALYDLATQSMITGDLFGTDTDENKPHVFAVRHRYDRLSQAVDTINQRFGAESVQWGISPKTHAGHVGTKIAFHRIPDLAEFQE